MTTLPLFPEQRSDDDHTPLPLFVAKKWGFPLAFHLVDGKHYYAIQDWVRGLYGEDDVKHILSNFKNISLVRHFQNYL
ncbi:hypothetical protein HC776_00745 [bacterium]|nr:hypothetical protein [bacterium]